MKTTHHTVVTQPASTITIGSAVNHRDVSIGQTIEQAAADTTKPSAVESLIESALPGSGAKSRDAVNARGADDPTNGGSDPGKGGGNSSSDAYASAAAALRESLNATFGDPAKDPTQGNARGDLIRGGRAPEAALTAQLGLPGSANQPDPHHPSQATDPFDHTKRQSEVDAAKSYQGSEESMVGAGFSTWEYDYKDKNGDVHHKEMTVGKDFYNEIDKDQTTGIIMQTYDIVDHGKLSETTKVTNPGTGTTTTVDSDGWVVVTDTKTGEHKYEGKGFPIVPIAPGGGGKLPDEDHQTTLSPGLANQVHKEIENEIKSQHLPNHKGDSINVVDTDIPGMVSTADTKGVVIGSKDGLISNPGSVGLAQDTGGSGPGLGSRAGDTINNLDQMSQSSGPEQPGHQPEVKHGTPGAGETGGQQSNGNNQGSSPAKPVETVALHAVVQLQDAVDKHDGPHQGEPIKPAAEKLGAAQIAPDAAHGAHQDAGSGFADLIRAAQNPVQSGLVATAQPTGPEAHATLQLAVNADLAGHDVGPHGVDAHAAAAAAPAAAHDVHVDQHAAPVLDHAQVAHH